MQNISDTYTRLWPDAKAVSSVVIDGVEYDEDEIVSLRIKGGLFANDTPAGIGGTVSREVDVCVRPKARIEKWTSKESISLNGAFLRLENTAYWFSTKKCGEWHFTLPKTITLSEWTYSAELVAKRYENSDLTWLSGKMIVEYGGKAPLEVVIAPGKGEGTIPLIFASLWGSSDDEQINSSTPIQDYLSTISRGAEIRPYVQLKNTRLPHVSFDFPSMGPILITRSTGQTTITVYDNIYKDENGNVIQIYERKIPITPGSMTNLESLRGRYLLTESGKYVYISTKDPFTWQRSGSEWRLIATVFDVTAYESVSEKLPKGVFYIAERECDEHRGTFTLHGYDAMLRASLPLVKAGEPQTGWPKNEQDIVEEICDKIGVEIDMVGDTWNYLNTSTYLQYPGYGADAYTMRDILSQIAIMHYGNWTITDAGTLRLLSLGFSEPEGTHFLVTEDGNPILFDGGIRILI